MAEAAARPDADLRGFELLDPAGVRAANPAVRGDLVGGLLCRRDAVVEPGLVLGALRVTLEATGRYTWLPHRQVVDVDDHRRRHRGGRRPPGAPPRGLGRGALHRRPALGARGRGRGHPGRRPAPPLPAPDAADRPGRRAPDDRRGRRRLDALLPGLRPARAGRAARALGLHRRVGHAAPDRPAGRRRAHHRRHPRLRRALRLRRRGAPLRGPASPGPSPCSVGRCPRWCAAGPACTPW